MTRRPDPNTRRGHWTLRGDFAPGAVFLNGVPITVLIPLAGARRSRVRFQTSANGGTLSAAFVRPDESDAAYTQNNPANVAVVAGTETKLDIDPHYGEGLLRLTFTPTGNGNVTFADVAQV